jgi:hypothetical protein
MRKVNDFKNEVWKFKRVQKTFENLNSFETAENAKNNANILKKHIFFIFIVFRYFWIFEIFYKKDRSKIG